MFSPLSAVSFLIFTLLYTPCIAAISTVRGELKSSWEAVKLVIMQCAVAWLTAFLFYSIATVL
jgi:ferrous iron transport protein B